MTDTAVRDDLVTAQVRSAAYELCVRALAWPTPEQSAAIGRRLAPILESVRFASPAVQAAVDEVLATRIPSDEPDALTELRRAHSLLFTPIESRDCPPYETAFDDRDVFRQTNTMADVAGFYRAHGLVVGGEERERPDHIATELEFMGFMARKEAYAITHLGEDAVAECRHTQSTFLADHLGCWAESFGARAAGVATHPHLAAAGRLVAALVAEDLALFGATPTRVLDEPTPQPEPDDGACGVCDTDCGVSATPVELGRRD